MARDRDPMMTGKTWVSGKWISMEKGLRNNKRNRRWLALFWLLSDHGEPQEVAEDLAWKILKRIEATP